jgi:hypothetical protein
MINLDEKITTYLNKNLYEYPTTLCLFMKRDNNPQVINYNNTTLYNYLFDRYRFHCLNILSFYIGTRNIYVNSLLRFFVNSRIFNIITDKTSDQISYNKKIFENEAYNKKIFENEAYKNMEFDIIFNHSLQSLESNMLFLEDALKKLKSGGICIIENIQYDDIENYKKLYKSYDIKNIHIVSIPYEINKFNNILISQKS